MIKNILKRIIAHDYAFVEAHQNPVEITRKMRRISTRYHKLRPIYDKMNYSRLSYALDKMIFKTMDWIKSHTKLSIRVISPSLVSEFDLSDTFARRNFINYIHNFQQPKQGSPYPHYKYRLHFGKMTFFFDADNKKYSRLQAKLKKMENEQ